MHGSRWTPPRVALARFTPFEELEVSEASKFLLLINQEAVKEMKLLMQLPFGDGV
jgi:hypothetical protein